MAINGKD